MQFSKKFKRAWMRSNQRMHDMLLARPRTRFLQRWPDPNLEWKTIPPPISPAALSAKASRRTVELAKPRKMPQPPPPKQPGQVDQAMLQYQPTQRIMELARPALKAKAVKKTSGKPKAKKRLYDKERVNVLAQRKLTIYPPEEPKKSAKPLSYFLPRLQILCQPMERFMKQFELPPVPTVKRLKLDDDKKGYECPERIKQLAQPREFAEFKLDEDFDPYLINPHALTYQASENIKKIAEPKHREEKRIKK